VPFNRPQEHVSLAPLTTLGIGGPARWFARATRLEHVIAGQSWHGVPVLVLGGGSNLVIADDGFDGLVLQMGLAGVKAALRGAEMIVSAGAGESWDALVEFAVRRDLAGLECLSGIPGTVGGTPIQNVGAYGQEVASVIESVLVFDCRGQRTMTLTAAECGFGYRTSRFKQQDAGRFIVCEVTFRLPPGAPPTIAYPELADDLRRQGISSPTLLDVREAVLRIRRRKGMVLDAADTDTRSVGSFFTNPVVDRATFDRVSASVPSGADLSGPRIPHYLMQNDQVKIPAAWLIEQSGFARGHVDGRVGLSTKHPLAIVNRGGATARDVVRLARRIKDAVLDRFGVALRPEPVFVGFTADPDIEFLRG
jgi:UDP-N-acetylmuramate dehydrogenase